MNGGITIKRILLVIMATLSLVGLFGCQATGEEGSLTHTMVQTVNDVIFKDTDFSTDGQKTSYYLQDKKDPDVLYVNQGETWYAYDLHKNVGATKVNAATAEAQITEKPAFVIDSTQEKTIYHGHINSLSKLVK